MVEFCRAFFCAQNGDLVEAVAEFYGIKPRGGALTVDLGSDLARVELQFAAAVAGGGENNAVLTGRTHGAERESRCKQYNHRE